VNPIAEKIKNYKAVFVPSLMLFNKNIEENLRSYVKRGGTIIATPRTGAKDWNSNVIDEALPGALSDVFGTNIEEYTGLPDGEVVQIKAVETEMCRRDYHRGRNWAEMLSPKEAEPFAHYQTGIYKDKPAATVNNFGDGTAMCIGTFMDQEFNSSIVDWLAGSKKIESVLPPAEGLEATKRSNSKHEIVFALNYKDNAMQIRCKGSEFQDLLSGERLKDSIQIEGVDAKILRAM
jgi:beta-galactosidase